MLSSKNSTLKTQQSQMPSSPFKHLNLSMKKSPYQIKLSGIQLPSTEKKNMQISKHHSFYSENKRMQHEQDIITNNFGGVFLPSTTRRAKFFSFHSETEQDQKIDIVQPKKIQLNMKRQITFGNKSIVQLLPIKITLYFTLERLQRRLMNIIQTTQQISSRSIQHYLNELNYNTIELTAIHNQNYKRHTANECIALILKLMLDSNMTAGVDPIKLEKLIIYAHQANNQSIVTQLQIKSHGITSYCHQFYQFQLMNPTIPSQIDKMNAYFEASIDKLIKNTHDKQLQELLRNSKDKFNQSTFKLILESFKIILNTINQELILLPKNDAVYTLVLDLDETLIHMLETEGPNQRILVRPYAKEFLNTMAKSYEIVIFTASIQSYADKILNLIDENRTIKHRLYRHHTYLHNQIIIKDLSILGRPLNQTIIVDNNPLNFSLQPQNGIRIHTWMGDEHDKALKELIPYLEQVRQYNDVRIGMKQIKHNSSFFDTA